MLAAARRWAAWPRGREDLARVLDAIEAIRRRPAHDPSTVNEALADLRAVLEWTTYQSASLAAARTIAVARRTRSLTRVLGMLDEQAVPLQRLAAAEDALLEQMRERNGYMRSIAERRPHLALPPPLVTPEMLALAPPRPPSRLALIQLLRKK